MIREEETTQPILKYVDMGVIAPLSANNLRSMQAMLYIPLSMISLSLNNRRCIFQTPRAAAVRRCSSFTKHVQHDKHGLQVA
ncbi:hypothetical protein BaRGS_00004553 [Batillaria attramentaria]|uniref:Uncharacterized protein n=1 Tax=Batillaria attramentaria TaxID=370345 RepID=A0ABD0LZ25_9CAEN